ncbi:hypothetical protein KEM56_007646, partial [Ascosphaera pollenicola]
MPPRLSLHTSVPATTLKYTLLASTSRARPLPSISSSFTRLRPIALALSRGGVASARPFTDTATRHASQPKKPTPISKIAQSVQSHASKTTETYIAYGATRSLFEACSKQADYTIPQALKGEEAPTLPTGEELGVGEGWWYDELKLPPTFSTWSQVTFLHMYLLIVRFRAMPSQDSFRIYAQHLFDHFSHDAESRMTILHGMNMRGVRNQYLKDLFIQWRGVLAAYDEGLIAGDAVLGAAVWRNLWKATHTDQLTGEEIDWVKIARIVAYMRRALTELSSTPDGEIVDR